MKEIIESVIFITVIFITTITSSSSFANTYHFEINANQSALEAGFDATWAIDQGSLVTGISAINNDDDYKIVSGNLALGNEVLTPGLRCDLGFKGLWGKIEEDHKDGDLMAIGFLLSAVYDIPETVSGIPLDVSAGICAAPAPLCFMDSDRYLEVRTSLGFHILDNAAIFVGYRYFQIRFDDDLENWKMSDDAVFVGYRLRF